MNPSSRQEHWDSIYARKREEEVTWFEPEAARSLELVSRCALPHDAKIIDIGGGTSRLVDGLLDRGFEELSVLDVSSQALEKSRARLGERGRRVRWITGDVTTFEPADRYALWHDRAVFHFLTSPGDRAAYVRVLKQALALQPVRELALVAHAAGALFHTDAAQSIGKVAVNVRDLEVDLLSVAGHKLYAPKGVGALYVKRGTPLVPFVLGASQERGLRPGTENVASIVGLGAACETVARDMEAAASRMRALRDRLWGRLAAEGGRCLDRIGVPRGPRERVGGHPRDGRPARGCAGLSASHAWAQHHRGRRWARQQGVGAVLASPDGQIATTRAVTEDEFTTVAHVLGHRGGASELGVLPLGMMRLAWGGRRGRRSAKAPRGAGVTAT